ncbi:MAG TPA: sugar ABC transporter ATP-binding protein [Gaiellaceae bacterium]|nr:sugar ABC transporter ATP-binding protein [Gaiellaceae bacterium]
MSPPALELRNLCKSFGATRALKNVDLAIAPGEIHGLLGENGSGKSTLIKILSGYHAPDAGELFIHGAPVRLPLRPGQFRKLGLDFVHQDLGLVPSLSVLENLRLGDFGARSRRFHISWRTERARAKATFDRYGLAIDPSTLVGDLSPVERALLAIVRAVEGLRVKSSTGEEVKGVLVLDEPTVFLPREGSVELFRLVREIAAAGGSALFVSHDLDEVREITDAITVLRDGAVAGTVRTQDATETRLIELILGRRLVESIYSRDEDGGRPPLGSVEALSDDVVADVSFEFSEGEVLGLTGLVGSGFERVPYCIFGAERPQVGRLTLPGHDYELARLTPAKALGAGIALIPADRLRDAAVGSLTLVDNILMRSLKEFFRLGVLRRRETVRETRGLMSTFDVRPPDPKAVYSTLSGGNQQKALFSKWLRRRPGLLLLHEPTQGVDVGARQQIFAAIRRAADAGTPVICASSDYEQLAAVCDRVLIFSRGRIVEQLVGKDVTKHQITERCYSSIAVVDALGAA